MQQQRPLDECEQQEQEQEQQRPLLLLFSSARRSVPVFPSSVCIHCSWLPPSIIVTFPNQCIGIILADVL